MSDPSIHLATDVAAGIEGNVEDLSQPLFPNVKALKPNVYPLLATLVVDAEEDFNWIRPHYGIHHSIANMLNLSQFQEIAKSYEAYPAYLLTYPILENRNAVKRLTRLYDRGECDLGIQLHSWVTPPFDVSVEERALDVSYSFAGNLPPALERLKLMELQRRFHESFGFFPTNYRAGRYGLGKDTPAVLEELKLLIDTSLAPRTDFSLEGGPDYSDFAFTPFWYGGENPILELPLCREIVGWAGAVAPRLYKSATQGRFSRLKTSALSWVRCAERITLSPEGNDVRAMKRLARALTRRGIPILIVSLHSSSLSVGTNPYVTSKKDVHHLYDRLSQILAFLKDELHVKFVKLSATRAHLTHANR